MKVREKEKSGRRPLVAAHLGIGSRYRVQRRRACGTGEWEDV